MINLLTDRDIEVLIAYADCDMCASEVARTIHTHPNNVAYHLDQIRIKTKLNPRWFWDLVKLMEMIWTTCPVCKERMKLGDEYKYCPNCGVKIAKDG